MDLLLRHKTNFLKSSCPECPKRLKHTKILYSCLWVNTEAKDFCEKPGPPFSVHVPRIMPPTRHWQEGGTIVVALASEIQKHASTNWASGLACPFESGLANPWTIGHALDRVLTANVGQDGGRAPAQIARPALCGVHNQTGQPEGQCKSIRMMPLRRGIIYLIQSRAELRRGKLSCFALSFK